ncbi:MAG: DUF4139 domain-containing protein [Bacteroidota bacterium]|jgi:uncharacterized protein (TIGR02231 family)
MKSLFLSAVLLLSTFTYAQNKPIKAKLQRATVYLQGAHLFYNETINLNQGINDLVFENISPSINVTSLQANSKEGTVMEVRQNIKYKEQPKPTKKYEIEIERVQDSLENFKFIETELNNKLKVLANEKSLLTNNKLMRGELFNDSLLLLQNSLIFLKAKLNEIYEQETKVEIQKNKNLKIVTKLNVRLQLLYDLQSNNGEINIEETQPIYQVIVTVYAETALQTQVNFNYLIANASWVPMYDLQATTLTNNFQLKYFANITQNSGLDWKNANLTLSTSNPNEANFKPELTPWYLSFLEYRQKQSINYLSNALAPVQATRKSMRIDADEPSQESLSQIEEKPLTDYINVSQNLIRTEYEIKLNYNIASDGRTHKVLINQRAVPMILAFAAVPKLCTDAFLQAKIVGWEDLNIIPGSARLYFDGTYVGEMYLNANSNSDTLSVNLGRDKTIAITRKKIKEKFKVKFIDNEKVETRTIELQVRNTKNIPIEMELEDQIPIVQGTEEIKVKLLSSDDAELDELTGKLKWRVKLGVKDMKKITFTYEIKYPKNKPVMGL